MAKLNHAHVKLDDVFKRRLDIVSKETEDIIERIAVDTQDIQQRLLAFSKVRQTRQDELYREWLQMYVVKLDEWKSLQLTQLQEELSTYQKQIIIQSQSLNLVHQPRGESTQGTNSERGTGRRVARSQRDHRSDRISLISANTSTPR